MGQGVVEGDLSLTESRKGRDPSGEISAPVAQS
jgi:hypothetical protein